MFDLDGTLLDSMSWHVKAWQVVIAETGAKVDDELIYLNEGALEHSELWKLLPPVKGGPKAMVAAYLGRQMAVFGERYSHLVALFPGAGEVLADLKAREYRLALVTSSHRQVLEQTLPAETLGLFEAVVTGDEVKRPKPDPQPYQAALAMLGLPAEAAVAVENAPAGIRSARSAGLVCCAVTSTLRADHLTEADKVVKNLGMMKNWLDSGADGRSTCGEGRR